MKSLIILVAFVSLVNSKIIIEEIPNNNGYAIIKYDQVKIINKFNSILHVINLTEINSILIKINNQWLQQKNLIVKSPEDVRLTRHIDTQLNLIQEELKTIKGHKSHPRKTRSLVDAGGRVLNFLFGTMDDEDKTEIENRLKTLTSNNRELVINNNKQVDINNQLQQEIERIKN